MTPTLSQRSIVQTRTIDRCPRASDSDLTDKQNDSCCMIWTAWIASWEMCHFQNSPRVFFPVGNSESKTDDSPRKNGETGELCHICCFTGNGHLWEKGKPIRLHQNLMALVKTAAWPWRDDNYIKNTSLKLPACLHEILFRLSSGFEVSRFYTGWQSRSAAHRSGCSGVEYESSDHECWRGWRSSKVRQMDRERTEETHNTQMKLLLARPY